MNKVKTKAIPVLVLLVGALAAAAQDTTAGVGSALIVSGYAEVYYGFDFARPGTNNRPFFLYNFNRHNEFNLNLGLLKAAYAKARVRANLAIGVGTYMTTNYAAETDGLKNVFEANVGYKLSAKREVWLDVGVLPSHIGFESAVGKDNWTLTRSLMAENSPYFESGAKLGYATPNGKWQVAALALNGWQRITRLAGNSLLSWGTQVYYKASGRTTLNWSTFFGTDKPDSARLWRRYQNLYGIFSLTGKLGLITGLDLGWEQKAVGSANYNFWYSPVGILRYSLQNKWAVALRGEYCSDRAGVIIATGTPNGFRTAGLSVNVDYRPQANALLRLEGRGFRSRDALFDNGRERLNAAVFVSVAVGF